MLLEVELSAVLNEISEKSRKGFLIYEEHIVIKREVKYLCEMLGFDPLAVANEGVAVIIVKRDKTEDVLKLIKETPYGVNAFVAGEVIERPNVILKNIYGGLQHVEMPSGLLLPRIC